VKECLFFSKNSAKHDDMLKNVGNHLLR